MKTLLRARQRWCPEHGWHGHWFKTRHGRYQCAGPHEWADYAQQAS